MILKRSHDTCYAAFLIKKGGAIAAETPHKRPCEVTSQRHLLAFNDPSRPALRFR